MFWGGVCVCVGGGGGEGGVGWGGGRWDVSGPWLYSLPQREPVFLFAFLQRVYNVIAFNLVLSIVFGQKRVLDFFSKHLPAHPPLEIKWLLPYKVSGYVDTVAYLSHSERRPWSDFADAQTDMRIRMPKKCHFLALWTECVFVTWLHNSNQICISAKTLCINSNF